MRLEVEGPCSLQSIQMATLNLNLHLQPCDCSRLQANSFFCQQPRAEHPVRFLSFLLQHVLA